MEDEVAAYLAAAGLWASTVGRLKEVWEQEFAAWRNRPLEGKKYVYLWADGMHFHLRLEEDRLCVLVLMGATEDGTKELITVSDGYHESEQFPRTATVIERMRHAKTLSPPNAVLSASVYRHRYPWQESWLHSLTPMNPFDDTTIPCQLRY